jgi:Ser/Thr protein kinase RdoA (MazF antagonist)
MNIQEVLSKYFSKLSKISFEIYGQGAINSTFRVIVERNSIKEYYILQKMNPIFDISIMEDIEILTKYLSSEEFKTPRVVRTLDGELFLKDTTSWWRLLTYIQGISFLSISSPKQANEAGKLVGIFHTALLHFDYEFKYKLPYYRDTAFIMKNLRRTLESNKETVKYLKLKNLASDALIEYESLQKENTLPKRVIHADLKISNIIFDKKGKKAIGLIDFDTIMRGTVAIELGDALRSWCMKGGEDVKTVEFNKNIYDSALLGYFSVAKFLNQEEKDSIPYGVKLITLELVARFIIDAFKETYWNLDSSKYKSLFDQNKKRAENQFIFFKEFSKIF